MEAKSNFEGELLQEHRINFQTLFGKLPKTGIHGEKRPR